MAREIDEGAWPAGSQIPSQRDLSKRLSINRGTVIAVLRQLEARGYLLRREGSSGLFVKGASNEPILAPQSLLMPLTERVAGILHAKVTELSGPDGTLPSIKELCAWTGASYRPVRKAISILCSEGVLESRGMGFAIKGGSGSRGPCIHVLGDPLVAQWNEGGGDRFLVHLERSLSQRGYPPPVFLLSKSANPKAPADHSVSAFVRFMFRPPKGLYRFERRYPKVPRIYLDASGNHLSSPKSRRKGSTVLYIDHMAAGRLVGEYLAKEGHEHVALVSHLNLSQAWATLRRRGLAGVYPETGRGDRRLTVEHGEGKPSWEVLLADTSITAWVCINDEIAIKALRVIDRLPAKKRSISVVGFDDSRQARMANLTSCDPCFERMAETVIRSVLNPRAVKRDTDGCVPIEPILRVRGSSRAAPHLPQ